MQRVDRQRLDKWLWFARLARSRTLAQRLVVSGRVRINRNKSASTGRAVKIGDILTIALDSGVRVLRITNTGARRGPATEARQLYEDLSPPTPRAAPVAPPASVRTRGSGRPTKKQRRAQQALTRRSGEDFPQRGT